MDDIKPMRVLVACEESKEVCKNAIGGYRPKGVRVYHG